MKIVSSLNNFLRYPFPMRNKNLLNRCIIDYVIVLLIWNGLIGLVRMEPDGPRDHALDLGAWLNRNLGGDVSSVTRETPGFDIISLLVLALLLGVFYSTRPADEIQRSLEEE